MIGRMTNFKDLELDKKIQSSSFISECEPKMVFEDIKLTNIRKWCTVSLFVWICTDFLLIYPKLMEKPMFPNIVGIILEAMVSFPGYYITLNSYLKKDLRAAKSLIILVLVRSLFGFLNPPGEEVGINYCGRLTMKWMGQMVTI